MRRLQILWLSHFVPYPPKGGAFQRSYNLIKRVGAASDVHLLAFRHKAGTHPSEETAGARDQLLRHCQSVHIIDLSDRTSPWSLATRALTTVVDPQPLTVTLFRSREMRRHLQALQDQRRFDVVHFETISTAGYLPDVGGTPAVLSHQGAESFMLRRRVALETSLARKAFFFVEGRKLARYERRVCPRFALNVVVSDLDAQLMRRTAPTATYATVENGVDVDYFVPGGPRHGQSLVFAGRLDQYSNRDGLMHFVRSVWPSVRAKYPEAMLHVVGNHPPESLLQMAGTDSSLTVHGFVPDVRPYLAAATAYVCPIRDGGGTRIKILDALACGLPVVSTSIGCEGIDVVPERDVLLADSTEAFVRQIGRVFESSELRQDLGVHARRVAEGLYSWDLVAQKLLLLYDGVASVSPAPHA